MNTFPKGGADMSRALLYELNGNMNGRFREYIDSLETEPRIAWYPSAGTDFRALMFLHPDINTRFPASGDEPEYPDIFIYSDYCPHNDLNFLDGPVLYQDERTTITVKYSEELPPVSLPLHREIVVFSERAMMNGRVVFLEIEVASSAMGIFTRPLVYVFGENEAFCGEKVITAGGVFSHIIQVRYGSGFGGGMCSGAWLIKALSVLGCEVFISDGHHNLQSGDRAAVRLYPELGGNGESPEFEVIRNVNSASWSRHGDVQWYVVK